MENACFLCDCEEFQCLIRYWDVLKIYGKWWFVSEEDNEFER